MTRNFLDRLIEALKSLRETASDETALAAKEAYPEWKVGEDYKVGDRVRYFDNLYRCLQAHTSQSAWVPEALPSLWQLIFIEEYPNWIQPHGSEDAYRIGDKVTHNNKRWTNTLDYNIYEPGVYGWNEVTE